MEINDFGQNNETNQSNSSQNFSNSPVFSTEQTNVPLPCPRCGMFGTESFCKQCGLDLVAYYQAQSEPNQFQQQNKSFQNEQYSYSNVPQYSQYVQYQTQFARPKARIANVISVILLIALAVLLAISIPLIVFSNINSKKVLPNITDKYSDPFINSSSIATRNGISIGEYDELKLGMSYAHVSAIIGCDGVLSDSGKLPQGTEFYTYTWFGDPNSDAIVHVTFKDDVVSEIMEVGLVSKIN